MKIRKTPGYSFDDVLLVPQHSEIASRSDVDISTQLGKLKLKLPLLASNMDTICEGEMAVAMGEAGGAGVLHRFATTKEQISWAQLCVYNNIPCIISVGTKEGEAREILSTTHIYLDAVCVDVAHGDHSQVLTIIQLIRQMHPDLDIIAGNVATGLGAIRLAEAGANIIKVGIGPGSVCSTRVVSGHGVPQLTAILDVREALDCMDQKTYVIADGGIRYPGDVVKSLAAGADAVMLGSLLAGTDEAAGERIVENGQTYKTFRGMASREVQEQKRPGRTPRVEGISAKVPYRGPVRDILDNLEAGIRSGFSYSGCNTIAELRERAEFIVVTGNTLRESHPYNSYRL